MPTKILAQCQPAMTRLTGGLQLNSFAIMFLYLILYYSFLNATSKKMKAPTSTRIESNTQIISPCPLYFPVKKSFQTSNTLNIFFTFVTGSPSDGTYCSLSPS